MRMKSTLIAAAALFAFASPAFAEDALHPHVNPTATADPTMGCTRTPVNLSPAVSAIVSCPGAFPWYGAAFVPGNANGGGGDNTTKPEPEEETELESVS